MNGVIAIAAGIGVVADLNIQSQTETAFELLTLVNAYFFKTEAYTKLLTADQLAYFNATLSVSSEHPEKAANASACYQKYTMDSADMDNKLSSLNSAIQGQKTRLRQEGSANSHLFASEEPLVSLLKTMVGLILSFSRK